MKVLFTTFFFLLFMNSRAFAFGEASLEKIDSKANTLISQNLGDPTKIEEIGKHLEAAFKESRKKSRVMLFEEHVDNNRLSCTHCPTHFQLTNSINAVLQKMKESLGSESDAVATDINRLNFLFYTVKSRQDDGTVKCERFRDITPDLKPTQFPGRFDLMAEDSFQFPYGSELQLLDPTREEIVYYYRGHGPQRNIVVKAVLTKDGGKFQYFYYRPTEDEKNPHRLPSIGAEPEDDDVTLARKVSKPTSQDTKVVDDGKDRFSLVVDPRVETRLKVIPKNVHLAKGEVIQSVMGTGLKVTGESALSLKGNQASINLKDEKGYSFVKVDIKTSLRGESTHTIEVPYEVQVTSTDASQPSAGVKASGSFTDSTTATGVKLQITDGVTQYLRAETMRNKHTGVSSYTVARDLPISTSSIVTVGVGRNEEKKTYGAFQHRKSIKENVTMVLDVRLDQDRKASITYQLKAIF
jgi:hypothetical protein